VTAERPEHNVDGAEDEQQREAPRNATNDDDVPARVELVVDCTEEEKMDEIPVKRLSTIQAIRGENSYQMRYTHGAGVKYVIFPPTG
jgi:hypothetical protein